MSKIEDLAEKIEQLLLRHQEVLRSQRLLEQQVSTLTLERNHLRSRVQAARLRIDALINELPQSNDTTDHETN